MQKRNLKRSTTIKPSQQYSRTSRTKECSIQEGSQNKENIFQKYSASTVKSMVTIGTSVSELKKRKEKHEASVFEER
jgi:hypothetical protein